MFYCTKRGRRTGCAQDDSCVTMKVIDIFMTLKSQISALGKFVETLYNRSTEVVLAKEATRRCYRRSSGISMLQCCWRSTGSTSRAAEQTPYKEAPDAPVCMT